MQFVIDSKQLVAPPGLQQPVDVLRTRLVVVEADDASLCERFGRLEESHANLGERFERFEDSYKYCTCFADIGKLGAGASADY